MFHVQVSAVLMLNNSWSSVQCGKDRGERLLIERVVVDVGCHMCFRVVKFERIELTS